MEKEKSTLTDEDRKLALAISDLTKEEQYKIEEILIDPEHRDMYLLSIKNMAQQKFDTAKEVLDLLQENEQCEIDLKAKEEEEQQFLEAEERVLDSLSPAKRKKVETMRQFSLDNDGDYFETSYRQFILMTDRKEVVETENSVKFMYAHKELDRQELQLPKTKDGNIFDYTYDGFDGKPVTRREIRQSVLDKDNENYHYIEEEQERLAKDGKYIATEENTFNPILK